MFGIVVPDKTSKIMRAHAHFKSVTQAKPFSGFKIVLMHDHNFLEGLGQYPRPGPNCFRELKYNSTFVNVPSAPA